MELPIDINVSAEEKNGGTVIFDVIIAGAGPGGLTAAVYNARAGLKVLVIEKLAVGGQIFLTDEIENYPGVEKASGPELIQIMETQAKKFGAKVVFDEITGIEKKQGDIKEVKTFSGEVYQTYAVIIASGARYRDLGVQGEEKFKGRGISNCATCDGAFYKGMEVAVVGGGDTAIEEGNFLTRFASKVYIIHRRDRLRATKAVQERAFKNPKIEFVFDSVVEEITGENTVEKIRIKNIKSKEEKELNVKGVFVFIGLLPNTDFLKGFLELSDRGYVKTDEGMNCSVEGVFACGDCIEKKLRQVITACGDGATAAYSAQHYVEKIKGTEYV